jgi:SAM-dependent methyltransferase
MIVSLPPRYSDSWQRPFYDRVTIALAESASVLDVGSGRSPAVPPELRPKGCRYVGLDLSAQELAAAPPGAYDETIVTDLLDLHPEQIGTFDAVVSWQVLEHVRSLPAAFRSMRRVLRGGGLLGALLSGRWAVFAVANRLVPHAVAARVLQERLDRDPHSVFPAHYDRATRNGIEAALAGWNDVEIIPRYRGATYLNGAPRLQQLYLTYENWAASGHPNLATHYLVFAHA